MWGLGFGVWGLGFRAQSFGGPGLGRVAVSACVGCRLKPP